MSCELWRAQLVLMAAKTLWSLRNVTGQTLRSHHVHEAGVTQQTSEIDSAQPCSLREQRQVHVNTVLSGSREFDHPASSHRTGRVHLLLCDLQIGFVGVVIWVELQSLLIVTDCFCVFVEAGQSQTETQDDTSGPETAENRTQGASRFSFFVLWCCMFVYLNNCRLLYNWL